MRHPAGPDGEGFDEREGLEGALRRARLVERAAGTTVAAFVQALMAFGHA